MQAQLVRCRQCGHSSLPSPVGTEFPRCASCGSLLPWIVNAGDENFAEIAEGAASPVLVDVWAAWSAVCAKANPALERVAGQLAGQIKLVKVNVEDAPELQRRFVVEAVPTLIVLRGTRILAYRAGAPPEPSLRAWLDQARTAA